MDASQLTTEKHSRAVFIDFLDRQAQISNRNKLGIPRPVESISPLGSDGPDYTNWYNYVITGPIYFKPPQAAVAVPNSQPIPPSPPIVYNFNYIVLDDSGDTWTWKVYDVTKGTWTDPVDSGYTIADNPTTRACSISKCFILYMLGPSPDYNYNAFLFVGLDGTLLQTITNITTSTGNFNYNQAFSPFTNYTYISNPDSPPAETFTINFYSSATNTLKAPYTVNLDGIVFTIPLDNAIIYVTTVNGNARFYVWGASQSEPTYIEITGEYGLGTWTYAQSGLDGPNFNNAYVFLGFIDLIIYVVAQDGTVASYSIFGSNYNGGYIYFFGLTNLQNCIINFSNTDTGLYDVYVFPIATTYASGATLSPVIITGLSNPQIYYVPYGPAYPTYGNDSIVIMDTTQSSTYVEATVYVVLHTTTVIGPLNYAGADKVGKVPLLNNDGVCLLETNGSSVVAHIITSTINTSIALPYYNSSCGAQSTDSMIGYFVVYGNHSSVGGYFLSIINSQTGELTFSNVPSHTGFQYQQISDFAGSNFFAYDYTHNKLLVFNSGTTTYIDSWLSPVSVYQYPEFADGVNFNINSITSQIIVTNSTGYTLVNTTIPYSDMANYGGIGDYFWSYRLSPHVAINIIDKSCVNYFYENAELTGYTATYLYCQFTDTSIMFWFTSGDGTTQIYIGFSTLTNTFDNTFVDNNYSPSMISNDPYSVYNFG